MKKHFCDACGMHMQLEKNWLSGLTKRSSIVNVWASPSHVSFNLIIGFGDIQKPLEDLCGACFRDAVMRVLDKAVSRPVE